MADLKQRIRQWTMQTAAKYCKDCKDTCCDGNKHIISFKESELELFLEKAIPIVKIDDLDESAYDENRYLKIKETLHTKNGLVIPRPALIQTSRGLGPFEVEYYLYVEKNCPFFNNGCEIHEDPRRPQVCRDYPVFCDRDGNKYYIKSSCRPFNQRIVREDFRRTFPEPEVFLGLNSAGRCVR